MKILKRILLFLGCFVVISAGIFMVGGALAGVNAVREVADVTTATQLGRAAGMAFAVRYGDLIYATALIAAGWIAFRWYGVIATALLCLGMALLTGGYGRLLPAKPGSQTASTGGPRVRLVETVTVKLPYGKLSLPAGTQAEVVGEHGDLVQLRIHTGQQVEVAKSKVR